MDLDAIILSAVCQELKQKLQAARLERVAMSDHHTLLFTWHTPKGRVRFVLRVHPSEITLFCPQEMPNAISPPPAFASLLRKHIQGGKLITITQPPAERILHFEFEVSNDLGDLTRKTLVAELMPRLGNVILLNQSGIIHDALRHVDHSINRYRETLPAHPYIAPPSQNKVLWQDLGRYTPNALFTRQHREDKLNMVIARNIAAFSPLLGREIVYRSGLDERLTWEQLSADERAKLHQSTLRFTAAFGKELYPASYNNSKTVHVVPLKHLKEDKLYPDALSMLSETSQKEIADRQFANLQQSLSQRLKSARKHLAKKQAHHEREYRAGCNAKTDKLCGELLLSNLHNLPPRASLVRLPNYYDNNKIVEIPLDPRLSPSHNANRYFKNYARNKRRAERAAALLKADNSEAEYLLSLQVALDCARDNDDLIAVRQELIAALAKPDTNRSQGNEQDSFPGKPASKKRRRQQAKNADNKRLKKSQGDKPLPLRLYLSSDNFTIAVGRNNQQNDTLTFKKARKDDQWFHSKDFPGAHVVILAQGRDIPERTLLEAAGLAAWFSGANRAGGSYVEVDNCKIRDVSKPNGAKPGNVIYKNNRTLRVLPLDPQKLSAPKE